MSLIHHLALGIPGFLQSQLVYKDNCPYSGGKEEPVINYYKQKLFEEVKIILD